LLTRSFSDVIYIAILPLPIIILP